MYTRSLKVGDVRNETGKILKIVANELDYRIAKDHHERRVHTDDVGWATTSLIDGIHGGCNGRRYHGITRS